MTGEDTQRSSGELLGDQQAHDGGEGDRGEALNRIAADDELVRVESAGKRRAERAGNAAGGAATDQDAQIAAPQPESLPHERCDAARKLGVAGLQPDRCPHAARPHRLRRDDQAAAQRHAPAVQRVGFDRVDFARRPMTRKQDTGEPEAQSAEHRNQDRRVRIESRLRGQPLARAEPEQKHMQHIHQRRHGRHHQPAERADHDRQQDQARFAGAHEGTQAARHFKKSGDRAHVGKRGVRVGSQKSDFLTF